MSGVCAGLPRHTIKSHVRKHWKEHRARSLQLRSQKSTHANQPTSEMLGRNTFVDCHEMTNVHAALHARPLARPANVEQMDGMREVEKSGNEEDRKHMQRFGKSQELVVSRRSR